MPNSSIVAIRRRSLTRNVACTVGTSSSGGRVTLPPCCSTASASAFARSANSRSCSRCAASGSSITPLAGLSYPVRCRSIGGHRTTSTVSLAFIDSMWSYSVSCSLPNFSRRRLATSSKRSLASTRRPRGSKAISVAAPLVRSAALTTSTHRVPVGASSSEPRRCTSSSPMASRTTCSTRSSSGTLPRSRSITNGTARGAKRSPCSSISSSTTSMKSPVVSSLVSTPICPSPGEVRTTARCSPCRPTMWTAPWADRSSTFAAP